MKVRLRDVVLLRRFVLREVVVEGLGPVPYRATRASHLGRYRVRVRVRMRVRDSFGAGVRARGRVGVKVRGRGRGRGRGNLRDGVLKVLVARRASEAVRRPDGVEPSVIQHAEPDDGYG